MATSEDFTSPAPYDYDAEDHRKAVCEHGWEKTRAVVEALRDLARAVNSDLDLRSIRDFAREVHRRAALGRIPLDVVLPSLPDKGLKVKLDARALRVAEDALRVAWDEAHSEAGLK